MLELRGPNLWKQNLREKNVKKYYWTTPKRNLQHLESKIG